MHDLIIAVHDILTRLSPDSLLGAVVYLVFFVVVALLVTRALRLAVHSAMTRQGHLDRTTISFLQQVVTAAIWVLMFILYAHLIPMLRALGTALLAGASVASVVIGLAAQSTLGNLVAGLAITLYRPFRLGDTLQVTAPTGTEIGTVELISLGYTTLRTFDGRLVVLPNSIAASQVTINIGQARPAAALGILIQLSRSADLDAARKLALGVAQEAVEEGAVIGCFLTRMDAGHAVLELRVRVAQQTDRDALRSKLLSVLAQRFAAAGAPLQGGEPPSFS
jgi:small conductance mechanosensitive channel